MRRSTLILIASGLASVAVAASAFFLYGRPAYVKIAVTRDSTDHQLLMIAAQTLTRERASVRFRLTPVNNPAAAAKALDTGNADFSVLRSDTALPANGKTVVIMHTNTAVLAVPAKSDKKSYADLRGKTVGILDDNFRDNNRAVLERIIAHHGLQFSDVKTRDLRIDEIATAVRTGDIDALFMIGPAAGGKITDAVNAFASAGEPRFVPVEHAQAISHFSNVFEKSTVAAGVLGGKTPLPAQEFETVSVAVRLFASNHASNQLVANVTRTMFELRQKLAPSLPLALQIQAPETARDARMPAHPGAIAYLDNEEVSLFDRFSDLFYLSAMVLSVLGSLAAAVASQFGTDERRAAAGIMNRLADILKSARTAATGEELDALQAETDQILTGFVQDAGSSRASPLAASTLSLLINQIHGAIRDRREQLLLAVYPSGAIQPLKELAVTARRFPSG